ncbi:hypothetical protein [Streptomyces echinatus]
MGPERRFHGLPRPSMPDVVARDDKFAVRYEATVLVAAIREWL